MGEIYYISVNGDCFLKEINLLFEFFYKNSAYLQYRKAWQV